MSAENNRNNGGGPPSPTAKILALATSLPERHFTQAEIYERMLAPHLDANPMAREIFFRTGVGSRHLAVDGDYYAKNRSTQERNEVYLAESIPLAETAIQRCLQAAGTGVDEIDDFIVVSCTGLDIPGLDLRLAGRLGMRPDLNRTCVLGMGCYAAFPGLKRAAQAVRLQPGRKALVLAVELCSLHFQTGDPSTENAVSSALFADGAAAALLGAQGDGPAVLDALSYCDYTTFDHMAFHLTDQGFRMRLSAYVPELLGAGVEPFVRQLLDRNGLSLADIHYWGLHPGSSRILDHIQEKLGLPPDALDCSRNVLRRYGNMSSPTVLFVLEEILRHARPEPGEYGVLMAFGPGLTMESALVRF